ncbi:MAG: hypothetical protein JOS17DRAFT_553973 [Linnemannia elongata]|nr:MAG: hypothetical protein JOS17DRAFT_553973 [Linnemannia elongata]
MTPFFLLPFLFSPSLIKPSPSLTTHQFSHSLTLLNSRHSLNHLPYFKHTASHSHFLSSALTPCLVLHCALHSPHPLIFTRSTLLTRSRRRRSQDQKPPTPRSRNKKKELPILFLSDTSPLHEARLLPRNATLHIPLRRISVLGRLQYSPRQLRLFNGEPHHPQKQFQRHRT